MAFVIAIAGDLSAIEGNHHCRRWHSRMPRLSFLLPPLAWMNAIDGIPEATGAIHSCQR
jgi:hypothetical protein